MFIGYFRVFKGCFEGVSGCFKVFQGCFEGILRGFWKYF